MLNLIKKIFKKQPKPRSRGFKPHERIKEKDKIMIDWGSEIEKSGYMQEMDKFIQSHFDPNDLDKNYSEYGIAYAFNDGHLSEVVIEDRF